MSSNNHQDPCGGGDNHFTDHEGEQRLKLIQDAMMAELGISRLDELPLEDGETRRGHGGGPIIHTNNHASVPSLHGAAHNNPWQIATFDNVEPGMDQLDDMHGGQLYRQRKGDTIKQGKRGGRQPTPQTFSNDTRKLGPKKERYQGVADALWELKQISASNMKMWNYGSKKNRNKKQAAAIPPAFVSPTVNRGAARGVRGARGSESTCQPSAYRRQHTANNPYAAGLLVTQSEFNSRTGLLANNARATPAVAPPVIPPVRPYLAGGLSASRFAGSSTTTATATPAVTPGSGAANPPAVNGSAASRLTHPIVTTAATRPAPKSKLPAMVTEIVASPVGSCNTSEVFEKTAGPNAPVFVVAAVDTLKIITTVKNIKIHRDAASLSYQVGDVSMFQDTATGVIKIKIRGEKEDKAMEKIILEQVMTGPDDPKEFQANHIFIKGPSSCWWKLNFPLPYLRTEFMRDWTLAAAKVFPHLSTSSSVSLENLSQPIQIGNAQGINSSTVLVDRSQSFLKEIIQDQSANSDQQATSDAIVQAVVTTEGNTVHFVPIVEEAEDLIDLKCHEEQQRKEHLTNMGEVTDDAPLLLILGELNKRAEDEGQKSILQKISRLSGFVLGAVTEPTPKMLTITGELVTQFFWSSEIYWQLPEEVRDPYIADLANKILLLAIRMEQAIEKFPEGSAAADLIDLNASDTYSPKPNTTDEVVEHQPSPTRRYSRQELIRHRGNAVEGARMSQAPVENSYSSTSPRNQAKSSGILSPASTSSQVARATNEFLAPKTVARYAEASHSRSESVNGIYGSLADLHLDSPTVMSVAASFIGRGGPRVGLHSATLPDQKSKQDPNIAFEYGVMESGSETRSRKTQTTNKSEDGTEEYWERRNELVLKEEASIDAGLQKGGLAVSCFSPENVSVDLPNRKSPGPRKQSTPSIIWPLPRPRQSLRIPPPVRQQSQYQKGLQDGLSIVQNQYQPTPYPFGLANSPMMSPDLQRNVPISSGFHSPPNAFGNVPGYYHSPGSSQRPAKPSYFPSQQENAPLFSPPRQDTGQKGTGKAQSPVRQILQDRLDSGL
ncbi:hypothetical protein BJ878DRAFT_549069 [Calycina marina]|uniref:Uncharacterized protein n=1 Tax=Calycina marina TaxID=1763456 RepID=A0A9P7Z4K2_9HELO|nr:hypothetical protein BJ878DRAFT_549069 [Calycina marina]